jgi:hypothetical protein
MIGNIRSFLERQFKHPSIYLGIAMAIMLGRAAHMDIPGIVMDDTFISFRYAANLADGKGLVFNLGERVEGYTNFLWTVLLAVCNFVGLDMVMASKILAALAAIGTLSILYLLGSKIFAFEQRPMFLALMPVFLFATMPSQARYILSGMETHLFGFWLVLAIYLLLYTPHTLLAGSVFGLLTMTRPEGLMYFIMSLGYELITRQLPANSKHGWVRTTLELTVGFSILYIPYFLWRYSYYGYLLPNTFYVKLSSLSWERFTRGLNLLQQLITWWQVQLLLSLALLVVILLRWKNPVWWLMAGMTGVTCLYFVFIGGDFIVWFGPRFLIPVLPFLLLMGIEGMRKVSEGRLLPKWFILPSQIVLSSLLLFNAWYSWPARYANLDLFASQMRSWEELGRWIAEHTLPSITIATDAAGLIPFYSQRYAIDMFGLTDLHIAHLKVSDMGTGIVAHEKIDPRYILNRQPDCIVSTWMNERGHAVSAGLDSVQDQFAASYELVAVAKVRYGPPEDGRWVIVTSTYTQELYRQGYVSGLFCRHSIP